MSRPTIIPIAPRVLNTMTVCAYLGRSPTWLAENRSQLEAVGFPWPDPLLGGYDRGRSMARSALGYTSPDAEH